MYYVWRRLSGYGDTYRWYRIILNKSTTIHWWHALPVRKPSFVIFIIESVESNDICFTQHFLRTLPPCDKCFSERKEFLFCWAWICILFSSVRSPKYFVLLFWDFTQYNINAFKQNELHCNYDISSYQKIFKIYQPLLSFTFFQWIVYNHPVVGCFRFYIVCKVAFSV
jgi:hypothetical protein